MEVIKDSAPVDKRKLDPNKVEKVLPRGLSALSHKRNGNRRSLCNFYAQTFRH